VAVDLRRRVALGAGAAALVLITGGALLAGLSTSEDPAGPAGRPGGAAASPPGEATPPATGASPAGAAPVPGTTGDGYARNVIAEATCSPAGALGFTAQAQPLRCATGAADPHPRWRAP
jgi:hypothetical protein